MTGRSRSYQHAGARLRAAAQPGGQRCRRRQDRRRAEGPARRAAPADDDWPAAGVRRAAQGYRTRLQRARRHGRTASSSAPSSSDCRAPSTRCRKRPTTRASSCCASSSSRCAARSIRWRARKPCAPSTGAGTNSTVRFAKFEDRFDAQSRERVADPAIEALTQRLEQINHAVNNLPESLSLRSLEEKVRTLAGAVDHFARQQDGHRQCARST